MNQHKNGTGKNILIAILLIIVIILITIIILVSTGKLNLASSKPSKECITEPVDNNTNQPYVIDLINDGIKQEWTYEGVTAEDKKNILQDAQPGIKLTLPKINIDSVGAKSINSKIEEAYKEMINQIKNNVTEQTGKKVTIQNTNYNYSIRNNIIYILISNDYGVINGSGSSYYNAYYYDIEADKELTVQEALVKLDISEEYLKNKLNNLENLDSLYKNDLFSNIVVHPEGTNIKIMPKSGSFDGMNGYMEVKIDEYDIWTNSTN